MWPTCSLLGAILAKRVWDVREVGISDHRVPHAGGGYLAFLHQLDRGLGVLLHLS